MDCENLEAFDSPNFPPLALLNSVNFAKPLGVNVVTCSSLILSRNSGEDLQIFSDFCTKVKVETVTPGSFVSSTLDLFGLEECTRRPQGIILQLYGSGTAPMMDPTLLNSIRRLIELGVCVVAVTQCPRGACNLTSYSNGMQLHNIGVVELKGMTLEAAFTKLCYLLGKGYSGVRINELLETDLRGELLDPQVYQSSVGVGRSPIVPDTRQPAAFTPPTTFPAAAYIPKLISSGRSDLSP